MHHGRGQRVIALPLVGHHPVDQCLERGRVIARDQHVVERQVVQGPANRGQLEPTHQSHVQVVEWAQGLDHGLESHDPRLLVGLLVPAGQHADQCVAAPSQGIVTDAQPCVIRVTRHQLLEVVDRVAVATRGLTVLKGLHLWRIGGRGRADRHPGRDARRPLAHEEETGLDGVRHPILEQDAIGHVGGRIERRRVALDDDALQQIVGAAMAFLFGEQLAGNAAAPVRRVHARVTGVVHPPGLTVDVQRAARDHRQAGQHLRTLRIFRHGQHLRVTNHLGAHKEIWLALKAQLGRPRHRDLADQVLDAQVVGRRAETDGDGHG